MATVTIVGAGVAGLTIAYQPARQGLWYNNMDHSIGQGLTMADKIVRGDVLAEIDAADREFWATKDDGNVLVREEEIAEPLEETAGGVR